MDIVREQLLELIRSGMWGQPCQTHLFAEKPDWEEIYQQARKHSVQGVAFDGVQTLPPDVRPPRAVFLKWCNAQLRIEASNRLLDDRIAELYTLYRRHGIEPVLLKGQAVAQTYRIPSHRQCGDIDLFVGSVFYALANQMLRDEATGEHEENYKHTCLTWHGVEVENHRVLISLSAPWANRRLQREIRRCTATPDACHELQVGQCIVSVLPPAFNAVYILMHAVMHFLNEGIGLRHVCDWGNVLYRLTDTQARDEARNLLHQFGLTKAARIFGAILVTHLGLPSECLLVPYGKKDVRRAEWLMDLIWLGGNFGWYDPKRQVRPKGYWRGKWSTFTRAATRCAKFGKLSPEEAFWYPLTLAYHSAQVQWERLFGARAKAGR